MSRQSKVETAGTSQNRVNTKPTSVTPTQTAEDQPLMTCGSTANVEAKESQQTGRAWHEVQGVLDPDRTVGAQIIIRFRAKNVCRAGNVASKGDFSKLVRELIENEGLFGIVEDQFHIISVTPTAQPLRNVEIILSPEDQKLLRKRAGLSPDKKDSNV